MSLNVSISIWIKLDHFALFKDKTVPYENIGMELENLVNCKDHMWCLPKNEC